MSKIFPFRKDVRLARQKARALKTPVVLPIAPSIQILCKAKHQQNGVSQPKPAPPPAPRKPPYPWIIIVGREDYFDTRTMHTISDLQAGVNAWGAKRKKTKEKIFARGIDVIEEMVNSIEDTKYAREIFPGFFIQGVAEFKHEESVAILQEMAAYIAFYLRQTKAQIRIGSFSCFINLEPTVLQKVGGL